VRDILEPTNVQLLLGQFSVEYQSRLSRGIYRTRVSKHSALQFILCGPLCDLISVIESGPGHCFLKALYFAEVSSSSVGDRRVNEYETLVVEY